MALRNLVEGHCGEGNALIKLTHHVTQDKTHKEYKHSSFHHQEEPSGFSVNNVTPNLFVDEFLAETMANSPAFRMDSLLQEMQEIERKPPILGPGVATLTSNANTWAKEYFDSELFNQKVFPNVDWSNEFVNSQPPSADNWTKQFIDNSVPPDETFDPEALWNQALQVKKDEDSELAKTANELLGTVDDPKFCNSEFMNYMKKLGGNSQQQKDSWSKEFLASAASGTEQINTNLPLHEAWEKEFTHQNIDLNIDSEKMTENEREHFWAELESTWEKASKQQKDSDHPWFAEFEDDSMFKEYRFKEENPLRDHPDPLTEGKKCLELGDVPSAVLLFEAAVQKDVSNGEAWLLLGTTHAQNEQDPAAIPALRKGVELDPSNLNGWMSLATSYTNEAYQTYACHALKDWMKNNESYKHLVGVDADTASSSHPKVLLATLAPKELIDEVKNLYIRAANLNTSNKIDPSVQCGLGTLLNLTGEYDMAVDCFQSAIQVNPKDSKLWNKLGATLANGNRSSEAIDAYRNALEISPGFIRCRYNLGVACINLGAHKEAMEHFLEALNMQERGRGLANKGSSLAVSDNIWSIVRICLRDLNKFNLMQAVHDRDLSVLNKEFGTGSTVT